MASSRCAPFWTESPAILVKDATDFFPFHAAARNCTSTALNSLTRFGLYLSFVMALLYRTPAYLGLGIGIAILAVSAYYGMKQSGIVREGFASIVGPTLESSDQAAAAEFVGGENVANLVVEDVIGVQDRTLPSGPNPFMNMLVNEIKDNPQRAPAASVDTPEMARTLSDQFQTRMYGDSTDVFQRTQNQRTWYTMPSTSIPNDADSFQNWLFRVPGRTCKEGNNAVCRSGTEGGSVTWLNAM
jgi:hypothetical protein